MSTRAGRLLLLFLLFLMPLDHPSRSVPLEAANVRTTTIVAVDAAPLSSRTKVLSIVGSYVFGFTLGAVSTIPYAVAKGKISDSAEFERSQAQSEYDKAYAAAEDGRWRIADAKQHLLDLRCAEKDFPLFRTFIQDHCGDTTSLTSDTTSNQSVISDLQSTYGISFFSAKNNESRKEESIQRRESYKVTESYRCSSKNSTTSYSSSYSSRTTSSSSRYTTCYRTVTKYRNVHDYYRTTYTTFIKAGTAVQGFRGHRMNCGRFTASWEIGAQDAVVSDIWDRTNNRTYFHTITSTTRVYMFFSTNGTRHVDATSGNIAKSKSVEIAAQEVVAPFISERCITSRSVTNLVNVENYGIHWVVVDQGLPALELHYSTSLLPKEVSTRSTLSSANAASKSANIAVGLAVLLCVTMSLCVVPGCLILLVQAVIRAQRKWSNDHQSGGGAGSQPSASSTQSQLLPSPSPAAAAPPFSVVSPQPYGDTTGGGGGGGGYPQQVGGGGYASPSLSLLQQQSRDEDRIPEEELAMIQASPGGATTPATNRVYSEDKFKVPVVPSGGGAPNTEELGGGPRRPPSFKFLEEKHNKSSNNQQNSSQSDASSPKDLFVYEPPPKEPAPKDLFVYEPPPKKEPAVATSLGSTTATSTSEGQQGGGGGGPRRPMAFKFLDEKHKKTVAAASTPRQTRNRGMKSGGDSDADI